jgi:hypothetical protein
VYDIVPIDFGWEFLRTVPETAALIGESEATARLAGYSGYIDLAGFLRDVKRAEDLAEKRGWEGDFVHGGPRVFWLPVENEIIYGFVWKQSNNGTTFVVSPKPIPWCDELM